MQGQIVANGAYVRRIYIGETEIQDIQVRAGIFNALTRVWHKNPDVGEITTKMVSNTTFPPWLRQTTETSGTYYSLIGDADVNGDQTNLGDNLAVRLRFTTPLWPGTYQLNMGAGTSGYSSVCHADAWVYFSDGSELHWDGMAIGDLVGSTDWCTINQTFSTNQSQFITSIKFQYSRNIGIGGTPHYGKWFLKRNGDLPPS